eukprot:gnl/MRDRNA2_/MRDRNA2_82435_c0_seq2.p1 gnl/MRDRNA2_/MRDRNA2_82435_c0~~gnl/MRDRNA2_/MRDRNA2_82435_c0_seq2.p1  ORF type:complete len:620 (-),score=139.63 gnl/MRDRNA2_/MRDRNA2_82435_c0_seq2:39-1808(-)
MSLPSVRPSPSALNFSVKATAGNRSLSAPQLGPKLQQPLATLQTDEERKKQIAAVDGKTIDPPPFIDAPEHLLGAIDGSHRMERHLRGDLEDEDLEWTEKQAMLEAGASVALEPPPKRRRLISIDATSLSSWNGEDSRDDFANFTEEEEAKMKAVDNLLSKWGLKGNAGAKFVLESLAVQSEVEQMVAENFSPYHSTQKSAAEQLNARVTDMRSRTGPPTGSVDMIKTFVCKWGLESEVTDQLEDIDYHTLRYVCENYDGSLSVDDLKEAAAMERVHDVSLPGPQAMARSLKMDIFDPLADCLVLGDANLSFASVLAKHRKILRHDGKVIATTFETWDQLKDRYAEIGLTVKSLLDCGAEIWHGVDCTRLAVDPRFHGYEGSFGAVYYNFPHAGAVHGFFDGHPFVHWRHSNLLANFFRAIHYFAKPGAMVKVASNCNATGCRAQDIINAAEYSEFMHVGTFPFTEWILSKYHRSFGDKRDKRKRPDKEAYKDQQGKSDMVYCFRFSPSGDELPHVPIKQPIKLSEFMKSVVACQCGYISQTEMRESESAKFHFKPSGGHAVLDDTAKREACLKLYKRFLSEATGQHIG